MCTARQACRPTAVTTFFLSVLLLVTGSILLPTATPLHARSLFSESRLVRIWQDPQGMPHVMASSTAGVYWGFGYCLTRDRMLQLELLRRSVLGTLSECLGEAFLEVDVQARRDGVSRTDLQEGLARMSPDFRKALAAFCRGMNRAISQARAGRLLLDPGFEKLKIVPSPYSELEVLAIFAGTMASRYNDFSFELDNLKLLTHLVRKFGARKASQVFEDVVFYRDPEVCTTLGDNPALPPQIPGFPHLSPDMPGGHLPPSPRQHRFKRDSLLKEIGIPKKSGSYALAASNRQHGKPEAFLLGGPQMGCFKPSAVYAIGLHTPRFDLVGTTPAGYFCLLFGANRRIAFTATAGVSNQVDLVYLHQDPKDAELLVGDGFTTRKTVRQETFVIAGKKEPVVRDIITTPLGPVIAIEDNVYYIKQRAWQGRVVDSYGAWFASNHALTLQDWFDTSDRMSLSINWLGADRYGHIGYVYCGLGKTRKSFGDDRLPVGRPSRFPFPDFRLSGQDPDQGFYVNWNCPPVAGFRNGDMQSGWGADQRTAWLAAMAERVRGPWTMSSLRHIDHQIAFTDLRAWFYRAELIGAIDPSGFSPWEEEALHAMKTWNGLRLDEDQDGHLDHLGAGIFDVFWNDLCQALFADVLGPYIWMVGSDPTWTQTAVLKRILHRKSRFDYLGGKHPATVVTQVFRKTIARLREKNGRIQHQPVPPMDFAGVNHVGAPTQTSPAKFSPFHNRGSDVQLIKLSPDGILVLGITPPGNTALGKHATDQLEGFRTFSYYPRPVKLERGEESAGRVRFLMP